MNIGFGCLNILLIISLLTYYIEAAFELDCTNVGPLGMISGDIKDEQITASSTELSSWRHNCQPSHARLYQKNRKSWCAKFKSYSEWLQIDLGIEALITGVMTQGRGDGQEWVTSFIISYSNDGVNFQYIKDSYDTQKIFEGNSDSYTVKSNYFDQPIRARFVKFHTYHWHSHPSMRVELIGCQPCKTLLGVFPFGRLTSSGSRGRKKRRSCVEEYGHILSNKGWCSRTQNTFQWLQVDIGPPTLITALVSKGRGDGKRNHWVTHYQISYSNNSRTWYYYKEYTDSGPRGMAWSLLGYNRNLIRNGTIFEGNRDKDSAQIRYLREPFVARFIRFHPVNWVGRISMRIGVYGCKHKGECGKGFFRINDHSPCIANLAYKKSAWIAQDTSKLFKRHLSILNNYEQQYQLQQLAARAVDGRIKWEQDNNRQQDDSNVLPHSINLNYNRITRKRHRETCTELQNQYPNSGTTSPTWYVNLGEQMPINGVVIYNGYDLLFGDNPEDQNEREHVERVDRISVFVDKFNTLNLRDSSSRNSLDSNNRYYSNNFCGHMTRLNRALLKPKIHISCRKPLLGQFVYIQAAINDNRANNNKQQYKAIMCEVMVY